MSLQPQSYESTEKHDTKAVLREAVQQDAVTNRSGLLQRMFRSWFNGMVYNQIWEDPRVDAEALALGKHSRILTITSGGCNVLNYLIHDPAEVQAVDLNPHHMKLARLKIAALKYLPSYEDFLQFFGSAADRENLNRYQKYIRDNLSREEQEYWEKHSLFRMKAPQRIDFFAQNLYDFSHSGYFLRFVHAISKLAGCDAKRILEAHSLEEQQELFDRYLAPAFDNIIVKTLGKFPMLVFSLGIPPQQFESLAQSDRQYGIIGVYRERVRRLACNFPIQENYFAWQAFAQRYNLEDQRSLPDYLKREHYDFIRERLGRIQTTLITTTEFLARRPERSLNAFVFLDSQDWMTKEQLTRQWSEIARVGEPGSRIIFRTAGPESPIEDALPAELLSKFTYEKEQSLQYYEQDRSAVYGGFHLYRLIHE